MSILNPDFINYETFWQQAGLTAPQQISMANILLSLMIIFRVTVHSTTFTHIVSLSVWITHVLQP